MATVECQVMQSAAVRTLVDLVTQRKTRRFGCGMELPAGPLRYKSLHPPLPLSDDEEQALIFSAVGQTGMNLGDMQFVNRPGREDGQGIAMMNFQSRAVPSPCAAHTTRLFYTNDQGVFFVKGSSKQEWGFVTETVTLRDGRLEIPRQMPFMLAFNQWYTNQPGTTYFMPVTNVASVYINLLLALFSEEFGYFVVDTDNGSSGCGLDAFRKSRGGHLNDDIAMRRMMTLRELDSSISDTAIQEQGIVCEHIFLMQQALGLGGGIQSVGSGRHLLGMEPPLFPGLGFQFSTPMGPSIRPNPIGLAELWAGPCPPFVANMEEAVLGAVAMKFGKEGTYRNGSGTPWTLPESAIAFPTHSEQAIAATIAFCEYVHRTYGRFPAHTDAFKSIVACQAHHIDVDFYDTFYPDGSLPQAQCEHMAQFHGICTQGHSSAVA